MNECTMESGSVKQTEAFGRRIAAHLRVGDLVALNGELGAGKTQLVRGIAAGLGAIPRQVASPTFVLMNEYEGTVPIVHIDAYRIQALQDLESMGFTPELLQQSVTLVEWGDRIASELPADHLAIDIAHAPEGRWITLRPHGELVERFAGFAKSCQVQESEA